jgi:hypothetical protein
VSQDRELTEAMRALVRAQVAFAADDAFGELCANPPRFAQALDESDADYLARVRAALTGDDAGEGTT